MKVEHTNPIGIVGASNVRQLYDTYGGSPDWFTSLIQKENQDALSTASFYHERNSRGKYNMYCVLGCNMRNNVCPFQQVVDYVNALVLLTGD